MGELLGFAGRQCYACCAPLDPITPASKPAPLDMVSAALRRRNILTGLALCSVSIGAYWHSLRHLKPDPFLDAKPSSNIVSKG